MNKRSSIPRFSSGSVISEADVRGGRGRGRRRPPAARAAAPGPGSRPAAGESVRSLELSGRPRAVGGRPLRRWSVAELVARAHAVAAAPADRVRPGY